MMISRQNRCFISLAIRAFEIKKKFKLYTSEKEYAKAGNGNEEINKCLGTKFSESFNSVLSAPKNVKPGFFNRFLVEDSIENYILKSVFGFLGGIFLTYVFFMFLVFSLNFTLKRATYICIGLGIILSLGLAFSVKIRCTVFLCIPQLFSKRGRQALLAYAFILALSGPAKNTLHNVEVMSESLACTQEQLKQAENDLLKYVQKPNAAAKKTIEKLLEKINSAVKHFKSFILQLYKNCFDILETVLHAQKWLYSITFLCHSKMGKPAHRCLNLLSESRENCEQILPFVAWKQLCGIRPESQELICSTNTKFICMREDVPERLPALKLQKQLDAFKHRAMNIFYVSLEAHQTYSQTNRTYTYHEEYQGMATEIRQKTDQFLQYFDFMSVIFGIFILVLFVKVILYRHKFLTEDHYDNRYITSDFVDIDNTRAAFGMETLLPLVPRERLQYIKVTSVRLVPCERIRLLSSFVFLVFATFKIIIHMLTDSSLYWILSTVRRNERLLYMSALREEVPVITVRVVGDGLVAELFRNVSRAVKRESSLLRLDPTPCLPDPVPPDWNRYYQILALVFICWLLAVCEPYGLRLRHSVMVTYHPDRARERAIWLYNKIISSRISFVKTSRRELRRKYKDVWLEDTFRYKFMRKASSPRCLLCQTAISCVESFVKCTTTKCAGLYCTTCFGCLKVCSICTSPADYGDLSDLSEEKDSSEEECPTRSLKKKGIHMSVKTKAKKGEIQLNLKKTNLKLKETKEEGKCKSENLEQPTLFGRALRFCRSKMPTFRKLKALSDFESSDWDHDSTVILEGSSVEGNCSHGETQNEDVKKKVKQKEKEEMGDAEGDQTPEQHVPKVCLFRKVSPLPPGACLVKERGATVFGMTRVIPSPDMYFKGYGTGEPSSTNYVSPKSMISIKSNYSPLVDDDFRREVSHLTSSSFLSAKDSLQTCKSKRKMRKESFFPDTCRKCDSGVLVTDQMLERDLINTKSQSRFSRTPRGQVFVDPLELNRKYPEPKKRSPRKLPFIDPGNVHEFDVGTDSDPESASARETTNCSSEWEDHDKGRTVQKTQSRARVCYGKVESTASTSDSVKICKIDSDSNSSSESDCQFYYRPFRSPKCFLQAEKRSSRLKRASGKLNLKSYKLSASYSIETDSSNDKFLSVKPSRRVRKKQKTVKQTEEESAETPIKRLICSRGEKGDFLKAKLVKFLKKNMKKRKCSREEGTSDIESLQHTPVFLSEEEFEKISREITLQKANGDRDSKSLSWTPDLLADLPSC